MPQQPRCKGRLTLVRSRSSSSIYLEKVAIIIHRNSNHSSDGGRSSGGSRGGSSGIGSSNNSGSVGCYIGGRQVVSLLRKTATTPISPCRLCFFP